MSDDDKAPVRKGLLDFLDSKFGFWLTTTLLIAMWSAAYAAIDRFMHRADAERARTAEAARRDMDAVLKVVPLLFAPEGGQQDLGVKLLLSLRGKKAIEEDSLAMVQAVLDARISAAKGSGATEKDLHQAALILKVEDSQRMAAIANPAAPAAATPARQLSDAALPPRVYLQIGDEADRDAAKRLREVLGTANVLAPGIELVDARRIPARSELRYCEGKLDADALARVGAALQQARLSVEPRPLAPAICERVRFNQMEVWLQRGTTAAG
ncbi:hypothetical protein [Roseateles sp.]|uniref:hypothetical protein n=1 Tax=Roseateles sp. TaxID=1971397 RepID=UPI0025D0130A|nr:hypothetical protein [Roseateles sp.]MBV8036623.1 hypothetical protein [Roseateles sp.]